MLPKICSIWTEWNQNEIRRRGNLYGALGYYRNIKPAEFLKEYQVDTYGRTISKFGSTSEEAWPKVAQEYDLIHIRYADNARSVSDLLAMAEHFNKPVLMDIDDDLFSLEESNPAYEEYKEGSRARAVMAATMACVDGITVSTEPLKESIFNHLKEKHGIEPKIFVLPNCNDKNDWKLRKKKVGSSVVIGWHGSITHNADLDSVIPALNIILEKYKHVYIEILGGITQGYTDDFLKKFGNNAYRVKVNYNGTPSWAGFPELLASQEWDIGIAPVIDSKFNQSKSHIKWMEYASIGIPCVASKVYPYFTPIQGVETIVDGKTGYVAGTTEEWVEKLGQLVTNQELREQIGRNAKNYIDENWQWSSHIHKWKEVYDYFIKK